MFPIVFPIVPRRNADPRPREEFMKVFRALLITIVVMLVVAVQPATAQALQWTRQFGTAADDGAFGVAVDATGNAYVVGLTNGAFAGQTSAGFRDAFVRKYDPDGTE